MVLRLSHTLTSFSISLIYVLFRSFEKLWIGKPFSSCSSSPERFLVLSRRLDDNGSGAALIANALAREQEAQHVSSGGQLEPGSKAVSEILPLAQALTDRAFYSYLASTASNLAERQSKSLKLALQERKCSSRAEEKEADRLLREGAQRSRSIKAIVEEREDLRVEEELQLPAHKWTVAVRQEVPMVPPQAPSTAPLALTSQPSAPTPRPPPSSLLPQPSIDSTDPSIFPLLTRHHTKGNELVCRLKIDPWPLDEIVGLRELVVWEFVPRSTIDYLLHPSSKRMAKAKPVSGRDASALHSFVHHLYGAVKGPGGREAVGAVHVSRKERVGVVKWGSLDFYLTLRDPNDPNPSYGLFLFL